MAQQTGNDHRGHDGACDWQSRTTAEHNQDARRHSPGNPKHGKAIGSREKRKTELGSEEICDADHDGEPYRMSPAQRRRGGRHSAANFLA
jgi:hypothetical protein